VVELLGLWFHRCLLVWYCRSTTLLLWKIWFVCFWLQCRPSMHVEYRFRWMQQSRLHNRGCC